ncbi:MAG: sulfatase-like hydrolase/transferase [Byssovorax sp.]
MPAETGAPPPPRSRLAALSLSALIVPLAVSGHDLLVRRDLLRVVEPALMATYVGGFLVSLLVWGLCIEAARHARWSVRATSLAVLAVTAAFGVGGQAAFRHYNNCYGTRDALLLALSAPEILLSWVRPHLAELLPFMLVPPLVVVGFALARARFFGTREEGARALSWAAFAMVPAAMFLPFRGDWYQCLPPDMLFLNAAGGPFLTLVKLQAPPKRLPPGRHEALPSAPLTGDPPSIIVLFGESVRRDEVCAEKRAGCDKSPALDATAPDRIGYARAFSTSSCTELASATIWSGLPITASPDAFARAPLLFDYAKARGYRTAYISSQNLLFVGLGLYLRTSGIDVLREANDRTSAPPLDLGTPDEVTTKEALDFLAQGSAAGRPSLLFVHFSNTHNPYRQVPGHTPFSTAGLATMEQERALYRNSLAHNDAVIGDFLRELRRSPQGKRAIVVSLSDHGEAFWEHRAFKHTFDVYGEQIDVPLWIDAPKGSLPDEVIARMRRDAPARPTSNIDVTATVIDLLGALDEPAFAGAVRALGGTSLLRDLPPDRQVLLWNCPPLRPCPLPAHGIVAYPRKLHYIGREAHHECYDIAADPGEMSPLPMERCADLRAESDRIFGPSLDVRDKPR